MPDSTRRTLLVVEDNPDLRDNLRMLFEDGGFRVVTAATLQEAEGLLALDGISVVLADFLLPPSNGLDLLRTARKRRPQIRGVLMTAFGDEFIRGADVRKEGFEFIRKPFEADEIVELVERLAR